MIFLKTILSISLVLYLTIDKSNQTITSIALETDLNDPSFSECVRANVDTRPIIGYKLNSLLGITNPGQFNYQALSATIWFKPKFSVSDWSNNFGIMNDITGKTNYFLYNYKCLFQFQQIASLLSNSNVFTLCNKDYFTVLSLQSTYFEFQHPSQTISNNNIFNNTWVKTIILYQPLNKRGYARVVSTQNTIIFDDLADYSNYQNYFIHYMYPSTSSINNNAWLTFQHGGCQNYNSCAKQKYAMFHYSNDEAFTVDQIQALVFDNYLNYQGFFPISYYPLKRQVNNLISDQSKSFQKLKNIYSPNQSEAVNGYSQFQEGSDTNFVYNNGIYIANFNSYQYIQIPSSLQPYQFMISFVLYYNSISNNGITLFATDTNSFTIKVIPSYQLLVQLRGDPNSYYLNLGRSGFRHTIAFSVYGSTLLTKIYYYEDNNYKGGINLSSLLTPFSKIYIGGYSLPNDNFQIQDLYLIPNSDFSINYPTEPVLVPSNCNFFYSFNLNVAYCFSCMTNYQLNYYGQCVQAYQQSQIQQISFSYSYFGSNFISIVDAASDPTIKPLIYNYQISNNQFDFLILGYYQVTQLQNGYYTSLAYLQSLQSNQYYFLNIYLESATKITLKLTLDQPNQICYQSIYYQNSILQQWILLGFGYKTSTSSAYLVYQDKYGITKYLGLYCNGYTSKNSFQVCFGCLIPNDNSYSQFKGKVKNIKLIEGYNDYQNINQYIYFDQDVMDSSANNINYFQIYSLKDLFTYSLPGFQFSCPNGYYFLEGICVSSCNNIVRSQTLLGSYNSLFINTVSQSCEICPQNCLTCSSSSACTSCQVGFVVDKNSNLCIRCSQSTFYDNASKLCVQSCTNNADLMNMQCITQFDPLIQISILFFSSQLLTYNEGFQIMDSNNSPQQDTFAKCQGNNPYSFFMFYGGESVSSTLSIQKTWSNLPYNYQKQIAFTAVLFNFSSLTDLQVTLNGQVASQISMFQINQNTNICASNNQVQTQAIFQLSYQLNDNQTILQLKIKYKQNGFGIKNIQLLVNKCQQYYQISSQKCVNQCQSNEFISISNTFKQSQCNQCDNSCLTCIGPNKTDCKTCSNNYYLDSLSNLCVVQCQSNQYQSQNLATGQIMCMPCDQTCLTCSDQGKDKCLSCAQGLFFYNSQCLPACPNNYQANQSKNTCDLCQSFVIPQCQSCHITCKQCIYGKTDNNSCTSCYETKQLIGSQCQCRNTLDQRDNYFQCSYLNIAVLDIYLSSTDPLLTIEFGSQLNVISQYSTPSNQFCSLIFDANTYLLIGTKSTCMISGSQILVNLGDDSTVMENNEIILNDYILSFQGQTSLITIFYKTTVSQKYPGKSQLIFSYNNVENSCNDITIKFQQILNDAQRGLLSINWSLVSFSTPPSKQNLQIINQLIQQANQNNYTTLAITKYLVPVDSTVKIQVAYTFKVNQTNIQTFQTYYQMEKQIQVQYMQSIQPPYYRYMGIAYTFSFLTEICSDYGRTTQSFPTNIQITPSKGLDYLQNTFQSYQGQNLEIDILQYTLPSNQLSFFNVTFTLSQYPNIITNVSVPLQVLASPIFIKINGSDSMLLDYRSELFLYGTSRDFEVQDPNDDQGISLSWSCFNLQNQTDSNCYDYKKKLVLLQQNQSNITINANTFTAYSTLKFTFSGEKDTRQKQSSSVVCIFAELNLPPLAVSMNYQETYNINEDITAILYYNTYYSSDILSFAGALLYQNQAVGALKFDFYKVRFRIWDYFSNLQPGLSSLQIRFSVYNPYFVMPSVSTIEINVNFPPTNCKFTVSPQSGYSLEQVFTLSLLNCQDENQPLTYQFFYYNSLEEYQQEIVQPWNILRRQIQDQSYSNILQTILPQGNLTLMAQALDSKLAVYNTTLTLNVISLSSNASVLISFINQKLQQIQQLPNNQQVVNLNIIAEELSKNNQIQQSESINSLKQTILDQQFQQSQLLPNSSLLQTFTNKAAAQLQQSITYQNSSQSSLLSQVNLNLQNQMIKINNNKINQLQQDNNLIMQNLVDSFKILNATSLNQSSSSDQLYQINLSNQIGEMIINSSMIENQGSIQLQGQDQTILVDRITQKNLFNYAITSSQSNTNDIQSYSILFNTLSQNIYYNTTSFQDYANQIKKHHPNITFSNNQLIQPQIKSISNQNMLNDSIFLFQFNNSHQNKNFNMTCIQKQNEQWQTYKCQSKKNQLSNSYTCICQNQFPTTLIEQLDDVSDVLLENQNLNTAFGSQGWFNLTNFKEPYKYIAFWLLAITTLLQLILWYFGRKLDQKYLQKKLFSITPQTQLPIIQEQNIDLINLTPLNRFQLNMKQSKIIQKKNSLQKQKKRKNKVQMDKIDNFPSIKQDIESKETEIQIKSQSKNSIPFIQQIPSNNQNLNKNDNEIKYFQTDQIPLAKQKMGFIEKFQEIQILDIDQAPTYSSSEKGFVNQQKGTTLTNQDQNKNKIEKVNRIDQGKQENFNSFQSKNLLIRMMIFHDFFSIFFVYDKEQSRPLRFQIIYLNFIHSLAMSVLFCDFNLLIQRVFISVISLIVIEVVLFFSIYLYKKKGILIVISTILKILILLLYYYIILSVISGSQPSEANKFLELFLIATGMNFVIYQCFMALFKNIIILQYISSTKPTSCVLYIFRKLKLNDVLEQI